MQQVEVSGRCDGAFEAVRSAFEASFRAQSEVGAAVAVVVDGRLVVDLWGGYADQACTRAWQRDTLVNVYSTTKAMVALCAQRLVDAGRLDLDAPVAKYWPEFAAAGKGEIPVRWLLSHRAALAAVREPLPGEALYDWDAMCRALAAETPWWQPGETHGYHALTFGWLVGEVVRRIDGRSVGRYFREEVAEPLGAEFRIGVPDALHGRIAEMGPIPPPEPGAEAGSLASVMLSDPNGLAAQAFLNPPSMLLGPNVPEWRRAEIPGANGHASAHAIARIYGALARGGEQDGVRVLSRAGIERCREPQSCGPDRVLGISTRFGQGFMLGQADLPLASFGPNPGSFGHPGAGGSLGFADPEARVGFGYAMNRMGPHILLDPRADKLIGAVYGALR
jgi:CubicO group peptidase (beta-lactamase class C family)